MAFEKQFQRCCNEYSQLKMYVAWVGNPHLVIPFEHIHNVSKINAVVGVSFCQTHPEGLQFLLDIGTNLRIAHIRNGKKEVLFHPKIYIFSSQKKKALFIGSSNFTMNGFNENCEANVLIEGSSTDKMIIDFENDLKKWRTKAFSFVPDETWLLKYAERYERRRQKLKVAGLDDEAEKEEQEANTASWLAIADWEIYLQQFNKGLTLHKRRYNEGLPEMLELFDQYSEHLSTPWRIDIFDEKERRKMIGGMSGYGWLGHVGASGDFRRMLASGTPDEHRTIVKVINAISRLSLPLDYKRLNELLSKLIALGPTMKVWGRLLALVRPDLFCTISAPQVRKNIAKTLDKPEKYFESVEGYLMLLQIIHNSPWYRSPAPQKKVELEIWKRRVAYLDTIFYN